jgi:predicted RNase H-like HicB family nuclease
MTVGELMKLNTISHDHEVVFQYDGYWLRIDEIEECDSTVVLHGESVREAMDRVDG